LQDARRSREERRALGLLFEITLWLEEQRLIALPLVQALSQQWAMERDPFAAMLALRFAPLIQNAVPLPF
jgi:hypothetical protein